MKLRCSGASQGDGIKTMARLLRRNKGDGSRTERRLLRFNGEVIGAPTCHSDAMWICIKTPARLLSFNGWAVKIQTSRSDAQWGGGIRPKHCCPERSEAKGKLYQDPGLDDGLSGPAPDCSVALAGCMKTQAWLLKCNRRRHQDPSLAVQVQQEVALGLKPGSS